jgi:hypothetical protein
MREDLIHLSQKEMIRLHFIRECLNKNLTQIEAARLADLSVRQMRRLTHRVKDNGDPAIAHRLRGRPSPNRLPSELKDKVLKIYRSDYYDFGPTLAAEKLLERNQIRVSDETLRNWLIQEGLRQPRRRIRRRKWRERKAHLGEMIQMDGSHHAWFEKRGDPCVLMGYIDDATGNKSGQFYEYEGTLPAFESLKHYCLKYGVPVSVYLDRHSTYKSFKESNVEEQLAGEVSRTQFGRLAHELGIKLIHAQSAPAKGRVERSFKTDQDRLVKELRLRGISNIKDANRFLRDEYWASHNKKFSVPPAKSADLHRPAPKDLNRVFALKSDHPIRNDRTVMHKGTLYQIDTRSSAKSVTVAEALSGGLKIYCRDKEVPYKVITMPQRRLIMKTPKIRRRIRVIHPSSHPWRRPLLPKAKGLSPQTA